MMFKWKSEANLERRHGCLQCTLRSPLRQVATEEKLVSGPVEEFWAAHRQASLEARHKRNQPSLISVSSLAIWK